MKEMMIGVLIVFLLTVICIICVVLEYRRAIRDFKSLELKYWRRSSRLTSPFIVSVEKKSRNGVRKVYIRKKEEPLVQQHRSGSPKKSIELK